MSEIFRGSSTVPAIAVQRRKSSPPLLTTDEYTSEGSHFTGTINWVQLDAGKDDNDHLITAEERLRVAMARQ